MEEKDEFGIPIKKNNTQEVDEFGIPVKKKSQSSPAPSPFLSPSLSEGDAPTAESQYNPFPKITDEQLYGEQKKTNQQKVEDAFSLGKNAAPKGPKIHPKREQEFVNSVTQLNDGYTRAMQSKFDSGVKQLESDINAMVKNGLMSPEEAEKEFERGQQKLQEETISLAEKQNKIDYAKTVALFEAKSKKDFDEDLKKARAGNIDVEALADPDMFMPLEQKFGKAFAVKAYTGIKNGIPAAIEFAKIESAPKFDITQGDGNNGRNGLEIKAVKTGDDAFANQHRLLEINATQVNNDINNGKNINEILSSIKSPEVKEAWSRTIESVKKLKDYNKDILKSTFVTMLNDEIGKKKAESVKEIEKLNVDTDEILKKAGIPSSWSDAKKTGNFAKYLGGAMGNAVGSSLASIPLGGPAGMYAMEGGDSYGSTLQAKADALSKKYKSKITAADLARTGEDDDVIETAQKVGAINAGFEMIGLASGLSPLVGKLFAKKVAQATVKKTAGREMFNVVKNIGVGAAGEAGTEFLQGATTLAGKKKVLSGVDFKDTYSNVFMASLNKLIGEKIESGQARDLNDAYGMVTEEELEELIESARQGAIGGGGMAMVSSGAALDENIIEDLKSDGTPTYVQGDRVISKTQFMQKLQEGKVEGLTAINDQEAETLLAERANQLNPQQDNTAQTSVESTQPVQVETTAVEPVATTEESTQSGTNTQVTEQTAPEQVQNTLSEGTQVTLPAAFRGGMPRKMVYKDGTWQQLVGREYTVVSDKVQQQAQEAFDNSAPKAESKPTQKFGIAFAPYRAIHINSLEEDADIRNSQEYKQHRKNVEDIAKQLGVKISRTRDTWGGYVDSETGNFVQEVSNIIDIEATPEQARLMASMIGKAAPEEQDSVLLGTHKEDSSGVEHTISTGSFENAQKALNFLKENNLMYYSIDPQSGDVIILDTDSTNEDNIFNFVNQLKENGISAEHQFSTIEAEFIDREGYDRTLEAERGKTRSKDGFNPDAFIEGAKRRYEEIEPSQRRKTPPPPDKEPEIKPEIQSKLDKIKEKLGAAKLSFSKKGSKSEPVSVKLKKWAKEVQNNVRELSNIPIIKFSESFSKDKPAMKQVSKKDFGTGKQNADPKFQLASPEFIKPEDLNNKTYSLTPSDHLRVGVDEESGVFMMGGVEFPLIKANKENRIGWAVDSKGTVTKMVNAARKTGGRMAVYVMGDGSNMSNEAIYKDWLSSMKSKLSKKEQDAFIKSVRPTIENLLNRKKTVTLKNKKTGEKRKEVKNEYPEESIALFSDVKTFDDFANYIDNTKVARVLKADILESLINTESVEPNTEHGKLQKNKGVVTRENLLQRVSAKPVEGSSVGDIALVFEIDIERHDKFGKNQQTYKEAGLEDIAHPNYEYPIYIKAGSVKYLSEQPNINSVTPETRAEVLGTATIGDVSKGRNKSNAFAKANTVRTAGLRGFIAENTDDKNKKPVPFDGAQESVLTSFVKHLNKAFPKLQVVMDSNGFNIASNELRARKLVTNKSDKVYGVVLDGKVYLNPDFASFNTPIHEFGHVWLDVAKSERPELYNRGLSLLDIDEVGKAYMDAVRNSKEYSATVKQMEKDGATKSEIEEFVKNEALATLIGDKGELYFSEIAKKDGELNAKDISIIQRVKGWIDEFFTLIKNLSGIKNFSNNNFMDMTLSEYVDAVMGELVGGNAISNVTSEKLKELTANTQARMRVSRDELYEDIRDVVDNMRSDGVSDMNIRKMLVQQLGEGVGKIVDDVIADIDLKKNNEKLSRYWEKFEGTKELGKLVEQEEGNYSEESLNKGIVVANKMFSEAKTEGNLDTMYDWYMSAFNDINPLMRPRLGENLMIDLHAKGQDTKARAIFRKLKIAATSAAKELKGYDSGYGMVVKRAAEIIADHSDEKTAAISPEVEAELKKLNDELRVTREELEKVKAAVGKKISNAERATNDLKKRIETRKKNVEKFTSKLNSLKVKSDGQLNSFTQVIGAAAWNAAIDTITTSLEAGMKLTNAIDKAIVEIKKNYQGQFDEEAFRKFIESEAGGMKSSLETDTKSLIRRGLKKEDMTINDLIDKHYTEVNEIGKSLAEKLVDELGLDEATAKELDADIQKTLNALVKERQMKTLSAKIGSEKIPVKNKKDKQAKLDKVIADINKGALTDDMFTEMFADFYGFSKISPETRHVMNQYNDRLQALSPYPEMYNRVANDFWNELKKRGVEKFTGTEIFLDLLYHGALSGFSTLSRSLKGSLITGLSSLAATGTATPQALAKAMTEFFKGMPEGMKTAMDIMKTGVNAEDYFDHKPKGDSYVALKVKSSFSELQKEGDYAGMFTKLTYTIPHYMIRSIRAWDAILKAGSRKFHGVMIEYNKDFGPAAEEAYSVYSAEMTKKAQAQALEEVEALKSMGESVPTGYLERRTSEIQENMIGGNAHKRINYRGNEGVLMADPHGVAGNMYRAMQGAFSEGKDDSTGMRIAKLFGRTTFLIMRVPANFLNMGIDYSVFGLWRAYRGTIKMRDGLYEMTPEERRIQIVKAAMGTIATGVISSMVFEGDDDEEGWKIKEDSPIRIYGRGFDRWKDNESIATDWKPYSIQFKLPNGEWSGFYSYIDNPLGMMLAPFGDISDALRYKDFQKKVENFTNPMKEFEDVNHLLTAVNGTLGFMMSQSYQQGIRDLKDVLLPAQGDYTNSGEKLGLMAVRPVKTIMTPNVYQQIYNYSKAYSETPEKYSKGVIKRAQKGTPLVESLMLQDDVDVFGMPIVKRFDAPLVPDMILMNLKDNIDIREGMPEWRLVHKYQEVVVTPFNPPKNLMDGRLFKEEWELEYKKLAGEQFREMVNNSYDKLEQLEPVKLQVVLNKYHDAARTVAGAKVMKNHPR